MLTPTVPITLTATERNELEHLAGSSGNRSTATRARIILSVASGASNAETARHLSISRPTVISWLKRFCKAAEDRVAALLPKTHQNNLHVRIADGALYGLPRTAASWSVRVMAREAGTSRSTVQRVWKKRGIRPAPFGVHRAAIQLPEAAAHRVTQIAGIYYFSHLRAVAFAVGPRRPSTALKAAQTEGAALTDLAQIGRVKELLASLDNRIVLGNADAYAHFLSFLRCLADRYVGCDLYVVADWWHSSPERHVAIHQFLQQHPTVHLSPTPLLTGTRLWVEWVSIWLNRSHCAGSQSVELTTELLADAVKHPADVLPPITEVFVHTKCFVARCTAMVYDMPCEGCPLRTR